MNLADAMRGQGDELKDAMSQVFEGKSADYVAGYAAGAAGVVSQVTDELGANMIANALAVSLIQAYAADRQRADAAAADDSDVPDDYDTAEDEGF